MPQFSNVVEIISQGTDQTSSSGVRNIVNVFHYRLLSGVMDPLTVIGAAFNSTVLSAVVPLLHNSYNLSTLLLRLLDDTTNAAVGVGLNLNGAVIGDRLPAFGAVCIQLHGKQRGKSFQGSKHFGPLAENDTTKDELTAAAATLWKTAAPTLVQTLTCTNGIYQPIILSRKLSQLALNPTTLIGSDVWYTKVNATVGTMRRRKEKSVVA